MTFTTCKHDPEDSTLLPPPGLLGPVTMRTGAWITDAWIDLK